MAIILIIIITFVAFSVHPIFGLFALIGGVSYLYKSGVRTRYMSNEEVDAALNLKNIVDPEERKRIKKQIESNIDQRMKSGTKPPLY